MPQVLVRDTLRCSHLSLTKVLERRREQSKEDTSKGRLGETKASDFLTGVDSDW
jgi:hypothetical protein